MASACVWGELIRDLRLESGLSERVAAKKAGMARSTLRKIEAGAASTSTIYRVDALLALFDYELDALPKKERVLAE